MREKGKLKERGLNSGTATHNRFPGFSDLPPSPPLNTAGWSALRDYQRLTSRCLSRTPCSAAGTDTSITSSTPASATSSSNASSKHEAYRICGGARPLSAEAVVDLLNCMSLRTHYFPTDTAYGLNAVQPQGNDEATVPIRLADLLPNAQQRENDAGDVLG
jgi:hypothetical protein